MKKQGFDFEIKSFQYSKKQDVYHFGDTDFVPYGWIVLAKNIPFSAASEFIEKMDKLGTKERNAIKSLWVRFYLLRLATHSIRNN